MAGNEDASINLKSYIGITGMPDEIFHSGWVEYSGDLVMRYTQEGVRRILHLLESSKNILQNDQELDDIRDDLDFSIQIYKEMIKSVYDKWESYHDD